MKEIKINIPTNKEDLKQVFWYMTHKGRMKKNRALLNELYKDVQSEICSGYWNKDISSYMKNELFGPNGKIFRLFIEKNKELI